MQLTNRVPRDDRPPPGGGSGLSKFILPCHLSGHFWPKFAYFHLKLIPQIGILGVKKGGFWPPEGGPEPLSPGTPRDFDKKVIFQYQIPTRNGQNFHENMAKSTPKPRFLIKILRNHHFLTTFLYLRIYIYAQCIWPIGSYLKTLKIGQNQYK